jgi:ketosteroid isomerase-like protein
LRDNIDYAFPFAPAGRPERVTGRDNLSEYLKPIFARASYEDLHDLIVYETDAEETIIAEFTVVLRFVEGDRVVSGRYIVVVHSADGRIDSYRDYWNPLAMSPPAMKAA